MKRINAEFVTPMVRGVTFVPAGVVTPNLVAQANGTGIADELNCPIASRNLEMK